MATPAPKDVGWDQRVERLGTQRFALFPCRRRGDAIVNTPFSRCSGVLVVLSAIMLWSAGHSHAHAQSPSLAIHGYDPVAYFTIGKPVRGASELSYEWDEQRYHFVNDEHRQRFKAEPLRYLPQFAHFCTMALTRGKAVDANPEYWLISDGKLYLFSQPTGAEQFQRALTENIDRAGKQHKTMTEKR
jgi:YHS domain-containing protein